MESQLSQKIEECNKAGETIKNMLINNIYPKDLITKKSLKNAIKILYLIGGSTNAVIHLLNHINSDYQLR